MSNITGTFREECIIRRLWKTEENFDNEKNLMKNIDLRDEAIKVFIRNNYDSLSEKNNIKS